MAAVVKVGCNDGLHVCSVVSEMEDAADHGADRAENIMAATAVADDFASDTVFLRGEGEGNTCGGP